MSAIGLRIGTSLRTARVGAGRWLLRSLLGVMVALPLTATLADAQVFVPFVQRYTANTAGDLIMLANTVVTCSAPTGTPPACAVRNDGIVEVNSKLPADAGDPSIFNSSSSDLTAAQFPAGSVIVKAELYWGGIVVSSVPTGAGTGVPVPDPNASPVKIGLPGTGYFEVSMAGGGCAISPQITTFQTNNHFLYQCHTDVTGAFGSGAGTYRVANVPFNAGVLNRFAGWSIVMVVRKPGGTLRNFTINDGMIVIRNVAGATSVSDTLTGFTTPATGPVTAQIGAVSYDGDATSPDGFKFQGQGSPQINLTDACNPVGDAFNSTICYLGSPVTTRSTVNNNLNNTLGFDADIIQVPNSGNVNLGNGVTSATITASTTSEGYFLGVVTTAIDIYQPVIDAAGSKTQTNLTHPGLTANEAYAGDVIRYQITANNIGQDNATNVVLTDAIPASTTYVPGSLVVVSGPNAGAKTDAAADDQAEFATAPDRSVFRLGTGATATTGGLLRCPTCAGAQPTSTTAQFDVKISDTAPADTVINNAGAFTFRGATSGQDYTSNTSAVQMVVVKPSIGVAKQAGGLTDNGDGTFTIPLTFTVQNLGGSLTLDMLRNVQVVDDLTATFPAPATFTVGAVTATGTLAANPAFNGSSDTNLLNASASTLAPGGSGTISVTVTFNPHGLAGPLANQATVSATDPAGTVVSDISNNGTNPDPNGNGDPNEPGESVPTPILLPAADLSLTKTVSNATPLVGSSVVFTLTVINAGPNTSGGVTISDALPTGYAYISDDSGGAYNAATGVWAIGIAAPGTSYTLNITATVLAAGGYLNIAQVQTSDAFDPNSTPGNGNPNENDQAQVGTAPVPVADVSITKTGPASATPGQNLSYTLTVTNAGPSDAQVVSLTDPTPAGLSFVSASAPCAAGFPCALGTLTAGQTLAITVTYAVPANFAGASIVNTATLSSPTNDPNAANNSSTVTTPVAASADVSVSKSGPVSATPGQDVSYTLTVANAGPSDAQAVSLADPTPAGLSFVSASAPCTGGFPCALGTLTPGQTLAITVTYAVPANFTGASIVNTATVSSPTTDPDAADNTATVTTPVAASADIVVAKSVDNATPNVGDTVTFTVTATNNGPSDATGVAITDSLPSGLAFVGATPSQGSYDNTTGLWAVGALANGASATLTIQASVTASGTLTNTATRTGGDQPDPDASNNSGSASVNGQPSADIQVQKSVDTATPNVGANVTFTITASNAGPSDASGVAITDLLPAGLTFVSAAPSVGSYDDATGAWTIGALASGANATLAIVATVTQAGETTNTASVMASDQTDPDPANNQAGATINGQAADIQVIKGVDNADPTVGDDVMFTVTVTNNGPDAATGVQVSDALPAGLTLVSATPSQGTYTAASGLWDIGALAASGPGATVTLTIVATVTQAGTVTNTAGVSAADQTDTNPGNNSGSATLNGIASADLAVGKTGPTTLTPGDDVVYTIVVTNSGPSDATNVVVADPTPAGLVFVGNAGACTSGYPCAIAMLASGASATITSTYRVPADYSGANPIVNTATASSDVADPDPANNQQSASTNVGPGIADLAIVKTGPVTVSAGGAITYSLTVTNNGPSPADDASYADAVPAGITAITATCGGETGGAACVIQPTVVGNNVSGSIGTLPSGGAAVITINGIAPATATALTNTANLSPPTNVTDPNPADNSSSVDTSVIAAAASADLSLVKTGPASVTAGANVTYTLAVTNNGPDIASSVQLDDPTPAGLSFVSASAPCAAGFPCALGDLATATSVQVSVIFAVPAGYTGTAITNTATISSPAVDPNPSNNASTVTTTVGGGNPAPATTPVPIDARWMLGLMTLLLTLCGATVAIRRR